MKCLWKKKEILTLGACLRILTQAAPWERSWFFFFLLKKQQTSQVQVPLSVPVWLSVQDSGPMSHRWFAFPLVWAEVNHRTCPVACACDFHPWWHSGSGSSSSSNLSRLLLHSDLVLHSSMEFHVSCQKKWLLHLWTVQASLRSFFFAFISFCAQLSQSRSSSSSSSSPNSGAGGGLPFKLWEHGRWTCSISVWAVAYEWQIKLEFYLPTRTEA